MLEGDASCISFMNSYMPTRSASGAYISIVSRAIRLALGLVGDVVKRPHIVQPVGELDQQHADVVGHGEQEFAEILGGALVLALRLDLGELGDAIDHAARHCAPNSRSISS